MLRSISNPVEKVCTRRHRKSGQTTEEALE
jgi:hypothetical protein